MKISIIGAGRLGGALALALARSGHTIENLVARKIENARRVAEYINPKPKILSTNELSKISSETILITTQDYEIENAANRLAKKLENKPFVFHTSGSLSSDILQNLKNAGCKIGSIHPLVSISDAIRGAERFETAYFCVEGDLESVEIAEKIVADLKGKSFRVATEYKMLYHASAVTASGHLVALVDAATEMLSKCGLENADAKEIFLPLIKSTIENLQTQKTFEALTGTFARADVKTFENHLKILRENVSPETLEVYLQLGMRSAHLAERQGANREKLAEILEKIALAKKNLKC
ncbi:MAG TPA: DUF2520 domain-containing protein [Pyrinomonadaceae bacterium]|nr:DUF2520 domain-containing protein [Pyrinomonadaceae bacterium]